MGWVETSYSVRHRHHTMDRIALIRRTVKYFPPGEDVKDNEGAKGSDGSRLRHEFRHLCLRPLQPAKHLRTPYICPSRGLVHHNTNCLSPAPIRTKNGHAYLPPGTVFPFSITLPHLYWTDKSVELPPFCQIFQVALQARVEYILGLKLSRRSWRPNET